MDNYEIHCFTSQNHKKRGNKYPEQSYYLNSKEEALKCLTDLINNDNSGIWITELVMNKYNENSNLEDSQEKVIDSNMTQYSTELVREIWDDNSGCRAEVSRDRDGLDLVEVRSIAETGRIDQSISFEPEQALLVAAAMIECANELLNRTNTTTTKQRLK